LLLMAGCSRTETTASGELNILTWDGYIPQNILDGFSESENVKINISNFESNEEMLAKISAGNSGYDLVIGSDYIIDIARKENLLSELDKSKIPNYENLDEGYLSKFYDPENKYTVPYSAGSPVIVYDKSKTGIDIKGYKDLWNKALKGKVLLIDDARNIVGITLKSLGESMNTTDKEKLSTAKDELMKLKENIHHLNYTNPHESLISGDVDIAYLFSSQAYLALEARRRGYLDIVLGMAGIYVVAELILFQPNEYDNNKLFYIWYMFAVILAADYGSIIMQRLKGLRGRYVLCALFMAVSMTSGALSIAREAISGYQLFSRTAVEAGKWIEENTKKDDVFITGQQHINPVCSLAGRQIICGSDLYVFFHGLDYQEQAYNCQRFYEFPQQSAYVLDHYGVDYIYVSDYERAEFDVNLEYIDEHYELVYMNPDVRIYATGIE